MRIEANKQLVRDAYASISAGNLGGFMDRLSDDVTWTFFGSHRFAKTFQRQRGHHPESIRRPGRPA